MSTVVKRFVGSAVFMAGTLIMLGIGHHVVAGGDPPKAKAPAGIAMHGGVAKVTQALDVEVAFHADGLGIYLYDKGGKTLVDDGIGGSARVDFKDTARKPVEGKLAIRASDRALWTSLDLSKVAEGEATAHIRLTGLPSAEEKELSLDLPFRIARVVSYVCDKDAATAGEAGNCPKCGQAMRRELSCFVCKKHPGVASDLDGQVCWICNAKLERVVEPMHSWLRWPLPTGNHARK